MKKFACIFTVALAFAMTSPSPQLTAFGVAQANEANFIKVIGYGDGADESLSRVGSGTVFYPSQRLNLVFDHSPGAKIALIRRGGHDGPKIPHRVYYSRDAQKHLAVEYKYMAKNPVLYIEMTAKDSGKTFSTEFSIPIHF